MKVSIRIKDTGERSASVSVKFYPPIKGDTKQTAASVLALRMLGAAQDESEDDDELD